MPTELYDPKKPFDIAFAFDADLQWVEVHEYELAKRKVEGVGTKNDYIATKPMLATLEGKITAMAIEPAVYNPTKLVNARDELVALGDKMAEVIVLSEVYTGTLVIQRVEISKGVGDGKSLNGKVTLAPIETTVPGTAQVPASKLRDKVKKRGGANKSGGSGSTGGVPKSNLLKGVLRFGFM